MPEFKCTAWDFSGGRVREVTETLAAANLDQAVSRLRGMGLMPTNVVEQDNVGNKDEKGSRSTANPAARLNHGLEPDLKTMARAPANLAVRVVAATRYLFGEIKHACQEAKAKKQFQRDHPVEPVHAGRTFSQWLEDVFLADEEASHKGISAIVSMGAEAVPFLVNFVCFGPGDLPARCHEAACEVARQNSLEAIEWGRYSSRFTTLFCSLRPYSQLLAPRLAALLDSHFHMKPAAHALAVVGSEAVPALLAATTHPDFRVRSRAISAMRLLDSVPDAGVTALLDRLKEASAHVRSSAACALRDLVKRGKLGKTEAILKALTDRLGDSDEHVRFLAVLVLREFGEKARPAIPDLQRLRDQPGELLRRLAFLTIHELGGTPESPEQGAI